MIEFMKDRLYQVLAVFTGIAAFVLRKSLYLTAVDAKGLFRPFSAPAVALLVMTVLVLLALPAALSREKLHSSYETLSWSGLPAALGHWAAAVGLLMTLRLGPVVDAGKMSGLWTVLGCAAVVCLFLAGGMRLLKKKPFFLLHVVFCVFLLLHLVIHTRSWSAIPQTQEYLFALLGAVALAMFSYYTAALEAGCGNSRLLLGTGLAAVYFCLAELAASGYPGLYLGGMLWALTGLCGMKPAEKKD